VAGVEDTALLAPLFGVLRGRVYTFRWSLLLILAYFGEGVVRAASDTGYSARLALSEIALAAVYFANALMFVRINAGRSTG